jgi:CBS-domain-containing membrane protein
MNRVPVTCQPDDTVEFCEQLMRENQVRRIPVVDQRGRCIGIVAQADIALHAPTLEVAQTIAEISKPSKAVPQPSHVEESDFYCGQPHEMDEILLLNRRRKRRRQEVRT